MDKKLDIAKLVDAGTGTVTAYESFAEKLRGRYLPQTLKYGALAGQVAILAAVMPVLPALGVVAVACSAWYLSARKVADTHEVFARAKIIDDNKLVRYDFDRPEDCKAFDEKYGRINPSFIADCKAVAALLGMKSTPVIAMMEPRVTASTGPLPPRASGFNFMAVDTLAGDRGIVIVGDEALKCLPPQNAAAIVAHEGAHIALGHIHMSYQHDAQKTAGHFLLGGMLVGCAFFSPVMVPVALAGYFALKGVGHYAHAYQSRHNENICDRTAAVVTGTPLALPEGLSIMRHRMEAARQLRKENATQLNAGFKNPAATQDTKPAPDWVERMHIRIEKLHDRLSAEHPPDATRHASMSHIAANNAETLAVCQKRFEQAFARAAVRLPKTGPARRILPANTQETAAQTGTLFERIIGK